MADEEYDDYDEEYEGEYEGEYDEENTSRLPAWLTDTPYWAISAVLHVILLLIIGSIVLLETSDDEDDKNTIVKRVFKKQEYDPKKKRDMFRKPEILNPEKEKPILKLKEDIITEVPKGTDENNLTNKNLMADSVNDAFGTGGGAAGAYGNRFGRGSMVNEGGSAATESAVLAALYWLMRHQHPDGHWSSHQYYRKNTDEPYKLIKYEGYSDGTGFEGFDIGVTALAMLAYLGFGETHRSGQYPEFRPVMQKAMKWMLKQQARSGPPEQEGRFGKEHPEEWIYNHAIATMAMAELLVLTEDRLKLSKCVEKATRYCLRSQNEGYGWRYGYKPARNDTSVTGWMVLALKTARACTKQRLIKIDNSEYQQPFEWALAWFHTSTARSGKCGYQSPGDPGSTLLKAYEDPYPFTKDLSCMTAVSVLCRLFAGESRRNAEIKKGVSIMMEELPDWRPARNKRKSKINMYYWYYATYAMFQHGGSQWREWNKAMQESLLPTQIQGGDEDGSWDPIGEWGIAGGRAYATAINAMTLEVYYRFVRAGS
ncbi:MAG: prenyltransferase/squalene oxidase repeat-containing protein [Planctomycetota bacterium]